MTLASTKYSERRPRMANTFEVNTRKGSVVTAKMAGMESTANSRSLVSTTTRARSIGVAARRPSIAVKKCWLRISPVTG